MLLPSILSCLSFDPSYHPSIHLDSSSLLPGHGHVWEASSCPKGAGGPPLISSQVWESICVYGMGTCGELPEREANNSYIRERKEN